MANEEHVARLKQGVETWNAWRRENREILRPDLSWAELNDATLGGANLSAANLTGADLRKANLSAAHLPEANLSGANLTRAKLNNAFLGGANLSGADLLEADLSEADLGETNLYGANLTSANLTRANLSGADLREANLRGAILTQADLREANLREANLTEADLSGATLTRADLREANLTRAILSGAILSGAILGAADLRETILSGADLRWTSLVDSDLTGADLRWASLVDTDLTGADLTGCQIYGISAWKLNLEGAKQQNLVITAPGEPEITVDNLEVAQFVYLLLNNPKIRDVIDTSGKKGVLILGRFPDERKTVLEALRDGLRNRGYVPILFAFPVLAGRDITETIATLTHMARFIIADLTDPSGISQALAAIVSHLAVPVQPLVEGTGRRSAMFKGYRTSEWVLPVYRYEALGALRIALEEKVISPAETKVKALEERRRLIEAELTKPQ